MARTLPTIAAVASVSALILAGCLYDWAVTTTSDPDGGGTSEGGVDGASSSGTSGTSGTSPPMPVTECKTSSQCQPTEYCVFPDHHCGKTGTGKCIPRPAACINAYLCGCTGFAKSDCEIYDAGGDLTDDPAYCPGLVEPQTFRCGYRFCNSDKEYCVIHETTPGMEYECKTLCATEDCNCSDIKLGGCASGCVVVDAGVVQVKCPK